MNETKLFGLINDDLSLANRVKVFIFRLIFHHYSNAKDKINYTNIAVCGFIGHKYALNDLHVILCAFVVQNQYQHRKFANTHFCPLINKYFRLLSNKGNLT